MTTRSFLARGEAVPSRGSIRLQGHYLPETIASPGPFVRGILLADYAGGFFCFGLAFADAAVTALALLEFDEGIEQAGAAEIGPERFCHENFGVGNLPEQEIADAHLAAGADEQVRVRQAAGVQMTR